MNDLKYFYFEKYSPIFERDLLYTQFFIICDNTKIHKNTFVSEKNILCKIYCEYDIIQKMFKYDYNAKIEIYSDETLPNNKEYKISDLEKITKKIGDVNYCEFNFTVGSSFFDKIYPAQKKLYISIRTKSAWISMPIFNKLGFSVSSKLYKNIKNIDILANMKKLYSDITDNQISTADRIIVLKMISVYELYLQGYMSHDKFVKIIELYEEKNEKELFKMLKKYDKCFYNTSVSSICSLYNNVRDESIKIHIYNILLYLTDNSDIAKHISENPQIMTLDNIYYDIPHLYNSIKNLMDVIVNLKDDRQNNLVTAINYMNKLCSYVRYSYN